MNPYAEIWQHNSQHGIHNFCQCQFILKKDTVSKLSTYHGQACYLDEESFNAVKIYLHKKVHSKLPLKSSPWLYTHPLVNKHIIIHFVMMFESLIENSK